MTSKERFEMATLPELLRIAAARIEAANRLLTAAEAAEKLIAQVRAIAPPGQPGGAVNNAAVPAECRPKTTPVSAEKISGRSTTQSSAAAEAAACGRAAVGRASGIAAACDRRSEAMPERGSRGVAVFDPDAVRRAEVGKKPEGGRDSVPF